MGQGFGREVLLTSGLVDADGASHRVGVLRPLSGAEEAELTQAMRARAPEASLSRILATCLARIGGYDVVELEHVRALTRGDRQRLALELRADLFGDRLSLILTCPNPACRERSDLDLDVGQLADRRVQGPAAPTRFEVTTRRGAVVVREPTGDDDEEVEAAGLDRRARTALLWSRLVVQLGGAAPEPWWSLDRVTRQEIAVHLASRTTALDLAFLAHCPACSATIELELHPLDLLMRELHLGGDRLTAEVHCLAWYYGWSEPQILALPRTRRWRYIELVHRQLQGRPLVDAHARGGL